MFIEGNILGTNEENILGSIELENMTFYDGNQMERILGYKGDGEAIKKYCGFYIPYSEPNLTNGEKVYLVLKSDLVLFIKNSDKGTKGQKQYFLNQLSVDKKTLGKSFEKVKFWENLLLFAESLEITVEQDCQVGDYLVDFILPNENLVIEYNEKQDMYNTYEDAIRDSEITGTYNYNLLKLDSGVNLPTQLATIAKYVFKDIDCKELNTVYKNSNSLENHPIKSCLPASKKNEEYEEDQREIMNDYLENYGIGFIDEGRDACGGYFKANYPDDYPGDFGLISSDSEDIPF